MQGVAAAEYARHARHQPLIDIGALGGRVERHAELLRNLVLRQQADGEDQRIAAYDALGARDGLHLLIHLADLHGLHTLCADHARHGGGEVQGNVIVVQALCNVARKAGGCILNFVYALHFSALERQAAGHDHADVAAAEDHAFFRGHAAHEVDEMLRRARGVNAGGAVAVDPNLAGRFFPAAAGQHERITFLIENAVLRLDFQPEAAARQLLRIQDEGGRAVIDLHLEQLLEKTVCILRAGKPLAEAQKAEAIVNALL